MSWEQGLYTDTDVKYCCQYDSLILLPVDDSKTARWVANSVDTDQTPRIAASDLGPHCLLILDRAITYDKSQIGN